MEHLPLNTPLRLKIPNENLEKYIQSVVFNQMQSYLQIATRINWLLDRVHIESVSGNNNIVIEFIKPGQNKNDSGNWRFILTSANASEIQENVSGTWTTRGRWIGT